MKRLHRLLGFSLAAVLLLLAFPAGVRAGGAGVASCQFFDDKSPACVPPDFGALPVNTLDYGTTTRRTTFVVDGEKQSTGETFKLILGAQCSGTPAASCSIAAPACPLGQTCDPEVILNSCLHGQTLATLAVNSLCKQGFVASGFELASDKINNVQCPGLATGSCCNATRTQTHDVIVRKTALGCGFQLHRDPNSDTFNYDNDQDCHKTGITSATSGGNSVVDDLLPQYNLQVQVNGSERVCRGGNNTVSFQSCTSSPVACTGGGGTCVDSVLRFTATPLVGAPASFTVNSASFINNPAGLHAAIATGFQGLGFGLVAVGDTPVNCGTFSRTPEAYVSGPIVRIPNAGEKLLAVKVEPVGTCQGGANAGANCLVNGDCNSNICLSGAVGSPGCNISGASCSGGPLQGTCPAGQLCNSENANGFKIVAETDLPPSNGISGPALNPWGAALLAGLLLFSSLWFLRRRQRLPSM